MFHAAVRIFHHFVEQFRVGKCGALRSQMVTSVGGVAVEIFFRQAHFVQVFARCAVHQNGVGWRQVVGGDVVRQYGERTHTFERALTGQRAFPVGRTADVGRHQTPVVQRTWGFFYCAEVKHRDVDLLELLRFDMFFHNGVDFFVGRPEVFQANFFAVHHGQDVFFNVKTHGTGDGIGHNQWRRGEEGLFRIRVNAAVEVAVA